MSHWPVSQPIFQAYVEGYLQAMVDNLFKQEYLRVKISVDEVGMFLFFFFGFCLLCNVDIGIA